MGSDGSGDDIVAGEINDAESTTVVHGGRPSELDVGFNGTRIFEVAPRRDGQRPNSSVNGILGKGWNGADSPAQRDPGAGVIGVGGPNRGPGMVALGSGARVPDNFLGNPQIYPDGFGGTGMIGIGGDGSDDGLALGDDIVVDLPAFPAAGVVGRGGQALFNTPGPGHGPGVVGIAGGWREDRPSANLSQTDLAAMANVGVVGFGGDGPKELTSTSGDFVGPLNAGAGVRGIGGIATTIGPIGSRTEKGGPGVVGVAGKVSVPNDETLSDIGVAGWGETGPGVVGVSDSSHGMRGLSNKGAGVLGSSAGSNGGYFESGKIAQIHLNPLREEIADPNGIISGVAGDLLVTKTASRHEPGAIIASLWFCKANGANNWVNIA